MWLPLWLLLLFMRMRGSVDTLSASARRVCLAVCLACHATPGSHKSCLAFKCRSSGLAIKQLPLAAHRTLDAACSISSATPCDSICPFIISVSIGSWGTWGYYYWPARLALCKLIFRDLAILSVQIVKGNGS